MNRKLILLLFLGMNIFNYTDRQIISGIFPLLKHDFLLSDTALGLFGSAFMITYTLTAIPFGAWSDRWLPHKVAAIGVAVWSLSTMSSAFAWSFASLFFLRSLVGVGEAAYTSSAGTILASTYPNQARSSVLGLLNLGMPIGGAIGVILGGYIGSRYGWQPAFLVVGIPGLILAYFAWKLPLRKADMQPTKVQIRRQDVLQLFANKPFLMTSLGYAGISFAFGAIVLFVPTFFQRDFGYSLDHATLLAGALQVGAGVLGAPVGGWVADRWHRRTPRGRAFTLVLAMLCSTICLLGGLYSHSLALFFLSAFFMLWHVGVAASIVFDVVDQRLWNTAAALAMFIMHALGDIWSPAIVGYISDRTNLFNAFVSLTIPMVLAAVFFALVAVVLNRKPRVVNS